MGTYILGSYVKVTSAIDTLYTWIVWGDTSSSSLEFTKVPCSTLWVPPISIWRATLIGPKLTGATGGSGNVIKSNVPTSNIMLIKYVFKLMIATR